MKRLTKLTSIFTALWCLLPASVLAHSTVVPAEVATAARQVFTLQVPNERDSAVISVRLVVPTDLSDVTPTAKTNWNITLERSETDPKKVSGIVWNSGTLAPELREEFSFAAKLPAMPIELMWKVYETHDDGTIVAWDQPASNHTDEDSNQGPYSVTRVTAETKEQAAQKAAQSAVDEARHSAQIARAMTFVSLGLVLALLLVLARHTNVVNRR